MNNEGRTKMTQDEIKVLGIIGQMLEIPDVEDVKAFIKAVESEECKCLLNLDMGCGNTSVAIAKKG